MKEPPRIDGRIVFAGFIGLYLITVSLLGLIADVPVVDLFIVFAVAMASAFFLYSCVRLAFLKARRELWYLAAILSGLLQFVLAPLIDDEMVELLILNLLGTGAAVVLLPRKGRNAKASRERAV